MARSRESFHNDTITKIRDKLIKISFLVELVKLIYCLAHKVIKEIEIADNLAKKASTKASHILPRTSISLSKFI